jgi:hypothetical protein
MGWAVEIGDEFQLEFDALHGTVQTEILAMPGCSSNSGRN